MGPNEANAIPMDPVQVREKINERIIQVEAETIEVGSVENRVIEREGRSTPIRIYQPVGNSFSTLLMIHGGGWVGGSIDTHDNMARFLCRETKTRVISVGYKNSPEAKFPLPLEQCYDVLLSIEQGPIYVVGDSAGGNMAAALCLMARDRKGPKISFQALINPSPDLSVEVPQDDPLYELSWFAKHYLATTDDAKNPYASPTLAKSLENLPPALVVLAEKDFLFDMGLAYANRLADANIPTEVFIQENAKHLAGDGARASLHARPSLNAVAHALSKVNFE